MKKMLLLLITLLSLSFNVFAGVNLNTATQAELETLNGIGEVKAKAIIEYRKKNGGFKNVDELEKVDGIGAVTLEKVRKDVSVSGKTTVVVPEVKSADTAKITKEVKPAKEAKTSKTEKAVEVKSETKPADTAKVDKKVTAAEKKVAKKAESAKAE
ncbi:MAG: helix-hairpin-helix domain-containing protein [Methylotenera sp.]|nr:helix-hairpin-helix domain-containing protein [Methylotenera sp.]